MVWILPREFFISLTSIFVETYDEEYANKMEKIDRKFSDFDYERRKESFDPLPERTSQSDKLKGTCTCV